jgi:hypothetical protein
MGVASSDDSYLATSSAACEEIVQRDKLRFWPSLKAVLYFLVSDDWTPSIRKDLGVLTPYTLVVIIMCKCVLFGSTFE